MIQSMTGYGEGESGGVHCEIKTLNHRFFTMSLKIPDSLTPYEDKIRKMLKKTLMRGSVFLKIKTENEEKVEPVLDLTQAKIYYKLLEDIKKKFAFKDKITLELLSSFKEVFKEKKNERNSEVLWRNAKKAIDTAISKVIEERKKEGAAIRKHCLVYVKRIKSALAFIKKRIPSKLEEEKERLRRNLAPFGNEGVNEKRIEEEIILFADKRNVQEECTRLGDHLSKFRETLDADEPCGKKLIFLIQEMNREANTIASKARDGGISESIVNIKTELEDLRELVENVR